MSLCSVHLCLEYTISKCIYIVRVVCCVCTLRHGYHCLPLKALYYLMLILCAVISHFAYYFTICHLSSCLCCYTPTAAVYAAWPSSRCLGTGMWFCLRQAALPLPRFFCSAFLYASVVKLCSGTSFAVVQAVQLPQLCSCHSFAVALWLSLLPCFTVSMVPCHGDVMLTIS